MQSSRHKCVSHRYRNSCVHLEHDPGVRIAVTSEDKINTTMLLWSRQCTSGRHSFNAEHRCTDATRCRCGAILCKLLGDAQFHTPGLAAQLGSFRPWHQTPARPTRCDAQLLERLRLGKGDQSVITRRSDVSGHGKSRSISRANSSHQFWFECNQKKNSVDYTVSVDYKKCGPP